MTWTLILTLLYAGEFAHIELVDFTSREKCMAAAAIWLKVEEREKGDGRWFRTSKSAVCVER